MVRQKTRKAWPVLVAALAMAVPSVAAAQVSDEIRGELKEQYIIVEKRDGSRIEGKLLGIDQAKNLLVQVDGRTIVIDSTTIKSVSPRAADAQPAPTEPTPPAPNEPPTSSPTPPSREQRPAAIEGLLGRQALVVTGDRVVEGKLVELSDTSAVIEKDGGERVTVERAAILSARRRFAEPSPPWSSRPSRRPIRRAQERRDPVC